MEQQTILVEKKKSPKHTNSNHMGMCLILAVAWYAFALSGSWADTKVLQSARVHAEVCWLRFELLAGY